MAQIEQVAVGAGYADAAYYSVGQGTVSTVAHTEWDIAFAVGAQDLGIFINEGVASGTSPLPQVELYLSTATNFETVDTSAAALQRIYNDEKSWSAGAFNHVAAPGDPFDFGWGSYDLNTHTVNGSRIFVIRLRDGSVKKLQIQSLIGGKYNFHYADPDGSNEISKTITKADFTGKTLAYYRFADNQVLDLEPAEWDLLFTRYTTPLDDGEGGILEYMVTGVLLNAGVSVAQLNGIDPLTITYEDYDGPYADTLTAIGYDWKSFDLATFQWTISSDRVYLLQTADSSIWKVQFLDFEGSSTGVTTLEKTFQTSLLSSAALPGFVPSFRMFPNPATDYLLIDLEIDAVKRPAAELQLFTATGQAVRQQAIDLYSGNNRLELPLYDLNPGTYFLQVRIGTGNIVRKLQISR